MLRMALLALIAIILFVSQANAHPFPPDVTGIQMRVHYKRIDMLIRGPASELTGPAGVYLGDLIGEKTKKEVLEKLTAQLKKSFKLEMDGKELEPEIASTGYEGTGQQNANYYALTVYYPTPKPAEHLKLTSKFVHTVFSIGGVNADMHGDKDTTREFDTKANLNSVLNNVSDFVQMGMEHLFTGPDHILFILTLIFGVRSLWSAVKMLTGFTIGHSITLILCTFNFIHMPGRIADIGIALTIIYVGIENIVRKEPPKSRFWLVTAFGLIHGMSFSQSLRDVGLPEQGLVLCLLGFNLGIEIAQVMIVSGIYPLLDRLRWYCDWQDKSQVPGSEQEKEHMKIDYRTFKSWMNFGSAITACMGCYWLIERIRG